MASLRCQRLPDGCAGVGFDFFLERLGRFAQGAVLGFSLGQAAAKLLDGAGVAILAFDHQGLQIDQDRVHHLEPTSSVCQYGNEGLI